VAAAPASDLQALRELSEQPALTVEPLHAPGHLNGRYLALVRVSAAARDAYLGRAPEHQLPKGTVVAEFLIDPQSGSPGPIFAMFKRSTESWDFAVADAKGRIVEAGPLPLCMRCHAEAANGFVFGLPNP
jgi:hypothetical protein